MNLKLRQFVHLTLTCKHTKVESAKQCERQKCVDKELQALLDDDPTQTMLSLTMINLNQALIEKQPEWAKRHGKVILLHDNAPSPTSKLARHLEITWMGHPSAPATILRPGTI
jgi:hypothetical protein